MSLRLKKLAWSGLVVLALGGWIANPTGLAKLVVGPQPDGTFIVATGQRILPGTITFDQRLSEIAAHPNGKTLAIIAKSQVFLIEGSQMVESSAVKLGANAGFHGAGWTPDGKQLFCTTEDGNLQSFEFKNGKLILGAKVVLNDRKQNPVAGGFCINKAGTLLYVACTDYGCVKEVDLKALKPVREFKTEMLPFTVKLSSDESQLIVSNWGGEPPNEDDARDLSENVEIAVTKEGSAASGSVSVININSRKHTSLRVGIHPTGIAVQGSTAYIANSMDDSISIIDLKVPKVVGTIQMKFQGKRVIGSMPNELNIFENRLYSCNGGDNAICEIDIPTKKVVGYRTAGFFPIASQLSPDGKFAYVVNSKGNGSVRVSVKGGKNRNTHDFQGTVSVIDLTKDLKAATSEVAKLNQWDETPSKPNLKVYQGGIKHVIYVIKENRTYDEVFGDMAKGDGEPSLASIGAKIMPNHQKIANEFGLFDNAYTCGTNSADGHQWCDQAMANEYLEHFYVGYSRTYPDDGEDAMALNSTGRIWDAALKAGKTVRVYGEWAGDEQAKFEPRRPKDWFEAWEDRQNKTNIFKYKAHTRVGSLKPILCPDYHYWPLIQSDQSRIDVFEKEFREFEKNGNLPNLIVMSLPSDHSEGTDTNYPTPRSMMADNDLALGRLIETVSHSKFWKDTCIFVTQDDSQGGPDHIDGHRTVNLVVSPYSKRGVVNSQFSTQLSLLRSIEDMLKIKPMTKFDTIARPLTECFSNVADLTPYKLTPNIIPLGERNPGKKEMTVMDKYWYDKTMSLDWTGVDRADWYWLNRIVWYSIYKESKPYPGMPWDRPGMVDTD